MSIPIKPVYDVLSWITRKQKKQFYPITTAKAVVINEYNQDLTNINNIKNAEIVSLTDYLDIVNKAKTGEISIKGRSFLIDGTYLDYNRDGDLSVSDLTFYNNLVETYKANPTANAELLALLDINKDGVVNDDDTTLLVNSIIEHNNDIDVVSIYFYPTEDVNDMQTIELKNGDFVYDTITNTLYSFVWNGSSKYRLQYLPTMNITLRGAYYDVNGVLQLNTVTVGSRENPAWTIDANLNAVKFALSKGIVIQLKMVDEDGSIILFALSGYSISETTTKLSFTSIRNLSNYQGYTVNNAANITLTWNPSLTISGAMNITAPPIHFELSEGQDDDVEESEYVGWTLTAADYNNYFRFNITSPISVIYRRSIVGGAYVTTYNISEVSRRTYRQPGQSSTVEFTFIIPINTEDTSNQQYYDLKATVTLLNGTSLESITLERIYKD